MEVDSDDDDDIDDGNEAGAGSCGWTAWSEWSECTVTCGRGFIIRLRRSAVDTGLKSGDSCSGSTVIQHQQKPCRTHVVCLIRQYSLWLRGGSRPKYLGERGG